MTDDTDVPPVPSSTPAPEQTRQPTNHEDQVRWFLVRWTVLFMLLALGMYLFTRDIAILLGSSVIGIAVLFVFAYYFSRKKE